MMLNGEERFVVMSLSRNDMAAMINDQIDEQQLDIPFFGVSDTDDRLTDQICQEIADEMNSTCVGSDEDVGAWEREIIADIIQKYFS